MGCLTKEQIVRLTLGEEEDVALASHVEQCPTCRASMSAMRSLTDRLTAAHRQFDRDHEKARARLMTILAADERPEQPAKTWYRRSHFFGVLTMRQRIAVGSVGAAAVLCFLLLWSATRPVSAIARMAENIRRAKSYKATINTEFTPTREVRIAPQTLTVYWLAPGSYRMEGRDATARDSTNISPAGKAGIDIDHRTKTFQRKSAVLGNISGLEMLEELSTFSGQADRDLGTRQFNGKQARGFEIDSKKINPDGPQGRMEIWLDLESDLPLLVRWHIADSVTPGTMTWQDFHWNIDLDPKLFDPTPPEGYADVTRQPPSLNEQVSQVIEALKIYAELTGGHFPRGKMVYGDVTRDEMYRTIGIKGFPTPEQVRTEQYVQVVRSGRGFARLNGILRDNPDAAYYGKTVGPKNADKVLLRWQLEDGAYQVIFGDLRAETVTKERLRALEDGK